MNLTNEELRIKVAEVMGWKIKNTAHYNPPCKLWEHPECGVGMEEEDLPNYPKDLNSCASFEATLTDEEWDVYCENLGGSIRSCASAAPLQRCLAYLKTKGIIP